MSFLDFSFTGEVTRGRNNAQEEERIQEQGLDWTGENGIKDKLRKLIFFFWAWLKIPLIDDDMKQSYK